LAMYCLVLFYKAFKEELQYLNPVPKFLCVKAVVFLSFWQSLLIAFLAKIGVIPQNGPWVYYDNIHEVSTGIQDFCICIEMFLAAIAHYYSFSHKPFVNFAAEQQNCCSSFLMMWDVRDVGEDVVEHARYIGRGMHKTISRGARLAGIQGEERTPLLREPSYGPEVREDTGQLGPNSLQYLQNQRQPSPAEHIDDTEEEGDSQSAGGESGSFTGSRKRYGSFATKSSTSSMYNYAEFGASTEDGRGQAVRGVKGDKQSTGFEKSLDGEMFGGARAGDDEFEHLDVEDDDSDLESGDQNVKMAQSQENSAGPSSTLAEMEEKSFDQEDRKTPSDESIAHTHADVRGHEKTQNIVHHTDDNVECV
ncbi:transmembrane protein 184C-like, partial [Elysia marginata]